MSLAQMYAMRKKPVYATAAGTPPVDYGSQKAIAGMQGNIYNESTTQGRTANADYYKRISGFDPTAAINRYAEGTWKSMIGGPGGFNDQLTRLKGNEVAGGRLDTGFYDEDVGQLYRSTVSDFSNELARTAMTGAGMEMQNNQLIGEFGNQQTERGLQLGVARREELINDEREKAERKRRKKRGIAGAIGGVIGGVGGFFVGGPAGAAAGYGVGSKVGQGLAG